MSYDDFEPGIRDAERKGLDRLEARLLAERPVPAAAFRGELRRRIASAPLRRGLRLRVAACLSTGVALLAVAAMGVNGLGPLKPAPPADRSASAQLDAR